jgi:hypothetical protein
VQLARVPDAPDTWICRYYTDGNFPLAVATVEVCTDGLVVTRITDLTGEPLR